MYQVIVENETETEIVQRILFGLGYYWRHEEPQSIVPPSYLMDEDTIQAWDDKVLTHGDFTGKVLTFEEFINLMDDISQWI